MKNGKRLGATASTLFAVGFGLVAAGAQAGTVDLAGADGTGTLSMSNVKAWATEPDPVTQSPFPYYQTTYGAWDTIVAVPLSASTAYSSYSNVKNLINTQADFSTLSSGSISYSDALLTGVGTETIGVDALSFAFNNNGFSPAFSSYNVGSGSGNYGWKYNISASNVSGTGLTFVDGVLASVDLDAVISVTVQFNVPGTPDSFLRWTNPQTGALASYDGTLSIVGNQYAFDLDVTQSVKGGALATLNNTHMIFDRAGSIAAVTLVPEPSTYAMMAGGLLLVGAFARRCRNTA